jgi:hypothetical protein
MVMKIFILPVSPRVTFLNLCAYLLLLAFHNHLPAAESRISTQEYTDKGQVVSSQGLTGTVRDDAGMPVIGAMVTPRSLQSSGPPIPELAILSNQDGRYTWPLPPGNYELIVSADYHAPARGRATVRSGAVSTLDFVLRREP